MKLRTDIPKERRNNLLTALCILIFFVLAVKCTAQIKTSVYPNGITYKYNERPLYFGDEKNKERLCINLTADSLGYGNYKVQMTLKTPNEIGRCNVKIGFPDGSFEYLESKYFIESINGNVYELTESQINKLRSVKYDYVGFETEKSITSCVSIKRPTFFTDFLNNYYK